MFQNTSFSLFGSLQARFLCSRHYESTIFKNCQKPLFSDFSDFRDPPFRPLARGGSPRGRQNHQKILQNLLFLSNFRLAQFFLFFLCFFRPLTLKNHAFIAIKPCFLKNTLFSTLRPGDLFLHYFLNFWPPKHLQK